ncbi:MAG: N-acetyltransferase, partial [Alcaligenaceae bacterium]
PAFRGRGLMRLAMGLAIEFGVKQMGLQNIVALTSTQNSPAIRLLERLQFRPAATAEKGEIRYSLH